MWGATTRVGQIILWCQYFNPRTPCGVRPSFTSRMRMTAGISIHAPRVGCDRCSGCPCRVTSISIHAPRVGCDNASAEYQNQVPISIHAPRVGCDCYCTSLVNTASIFQSTHPVWGATAYQRSHGGFALISIHAPRVGCDSTPLRVTCPATPNFNPRTPCGVRPDTLGVTPETLIFQSTHPVWGATGAFEGSDRGQPGFQSTHPVWGATTALGARRHSCGDFNPRTPCGVRQTWGRHQAASEDFNPRTPCGVRHMHSGLLRAAHDFNPRTPCGVRRPPETPYRPGLHDFNPRTPCGVRRDGRAKGRPAPGHFNPRTPCGVRPFWWLEQCTVCVFQSTHPVWGATPKPSHKRVLRYTFQSTHPVWGATGPTPSICVRSKIFQSTHPVWGATLKLVKEQMLHRGISIHAPRVGCDIQGLQACTQAHIISIHAPRVGCDDVFKSNPIVRRNFNPRTPCGVRRQSNWTDKDTGEFQSTHPVWGATPTRTPRLCCVP